ncbi:MAG: sugar phosphate isomerase/epimerase, partial [Lentisphaeraceae bacterium]|nr:sugar phosphate isomerase/epimerase [Lentisphaeraceae bacterium]
NSQGYNRKEMLLASQTTGLKIVSVYNSHNWDRNLSALDEGERREAVRAVEESLTAADFYDAEYVQLLPGVVSNEHPEESKKSLLKSLQEISASLNHSKVKILLQNFPSHFYNEAGFFKNLLSSLSPAKFGICLNTETGLAKRELSDWIELLQKYPSKIDFQSNSDPCMKLLTESLDETGCISLSNT